MLDFALMCGLALALVMVGAMVGFFTGALMRGAGRAGLEEELAMLRGDLHAAEKQLSSEVTARRHLERQVGPLATVLQERFGGPVKDEAACEMAARLLLEQRVRIEALERGKAVA